MTVAFDPFLPWSALAAASVICLAAVALGFLRNWKSGLLRLAAFAALIGLLANPLLREAETTPLPDIALVLVDRSASQSLDGRDEAAIRAADALEDRIVARDVEVRRVEYQGEDETRTREALAAALADAPRDRLSGVFIVTDGQTHDPAGSDALGLDAPVHLVLTGAENERDRKITLTNAPRYGIVGNAVRISFRVDDLGADENPIAGAGSPEVTLRVDGEEVLRQPVPVGIEAGFDAPLDRPGGLVIELEVETLDGDLTTRNNIAVLPITAIRDRLRVLLISGEPHPGERVWRNLLKSDPAVDLVHFTILRPTDKFDGTPESELALIRFPKDELFIEKLQEFDLLIFDRYTYRNVLDSFHFDNVARYVENGGAVLIAAGPEFNGPRSLAYRRNLSFILPAIPDGGADERAYRPEVTELGARHPVASGLPEESFWGRWLRIMPVEQRSGQTLMTGPSGAPLLVLDRVGEGRVGLILSDHVWLWARGFDGGGPHAELLRRIAHWLMKEPELEEEALSLTAEGDALIVRRRTVGDAPEPVAIERPDGETVDLALEETAAGRFEARIANAPRGLYRGRSGELFAIGAVGLAAAPEFEDVVSTGSRLAPLREATGGGVFRTGRGGAAPQIRRVGPNDGARTGDGWAGLMTRNAARVDAVRDAPLAPAWAWLALIGAALLGAWLIESGRLARKTGPRAAPR